MYQLTITKTQLEIINKAVAIYGRLTKGTMVEVSEVLPLRDSVNEYDIEIKLRESILDSLDVNKIDLNHANIARDLHKVIRHKLAYEEYPQGGVTVNFDKPFKSSSEPLATLINLDE